MLCVRDCGVEPEHTLGLGHVSQRGGLGGERRGAERRWEAGADALGALGRGAPDGPEVTAALLSHVEEGAQHPEHGRALARRDGERAAAADESLQEGAEARAHRG